MKAKPIFGFWAWTALLMGISGTPKKVKWICKDCNEVVYTTRNREIRERFR